MRLLRHVWMLAAMFLAVIPAVLAQGVLDSPWTVFTINTVIMWFAIFVVLTLLGRSMQNDKEKQMLHVGGFLMAVILTWNFVGGTGYIWQVGIFASIFNLQFIMNTVLLTTLIYFGVLLLFGDKAPNGGAGKAGTWLLAIVISAMMAAKMPGYLWDTQTAQALIAFLFGSEGILTLNQNRLYIFVGSAVILAWFFNHIKVGGEQGASNKINWAIALIIAANMASGPDPATAQQVTLLGQAVGTYIIWMNLRNSMGQEQGWLAFIMAAVLVEWVVSTIFPEYALFGITGNFSWFGSLGWGLVLLVAVIFFFVIRKRHRALTETTARGWNSFRNWLFKRRGFAEAMHSYNVGGHTISDELTNAFKELRLEIFTLISYIQRHEVFKKKKQNLVNDMIGKLQQSESSLAKEGPNIHELHSEMRKYIDGTISGKGQNPVDKFGFADQRRIVRTLVDDILRDFLEDGLHKDFSHLDTDTSVKNTVMDLMNNRIRPLVSDGKDALGHLKSISLPRFEAVSLIKAYRPVLIDMFNPHGQYLRGYGFVSPDAKPDLYRCGSVQDNGVTRNINWKKTAKVGQSQQAILTNADRFIEVDIRGFAVDDINAIQAERKDDPTGLGDAIIRKYRQDDIMFLHKPGHPYFSTVMELAEKDWEYLRRDVERLEFHPYSRKEADYNQHYRQGYANFEKVRHSGKKDPSEVGFDREALKAPGNFVYWGRKNYGDKSEDSVLSEPANPYPGISLTGLWMFINGVTRAKDPADIADKYLHYLSMGYSQDLESMKEDQGNKQDNRQQREGDGSQQ